MNIMLTIKNYMIALGSSLVHSLVGYESKRWHSESDSRNDLFQAIQKIF